MPSILIRHVPQHTIDRLKARAARHGRSLQAEALDALEADGPHSGDALADTIARLHARRKPSFDLAVALQLLREDRYR